MMLQGKTYVMYITMDNEKDFDHWMKLATVSKPSQQQQAIYFL